jgi:DNA-binding response OmpR family regulator
LGLPRLLLVEPDAPAPCSACCVQDWVRLPAGEADITGRLRTLEIRAARHSPAPTLDPDGRLAYRGQALYLSVQLERVARILVDHFDTVVSPDVLRDDGWPAGMHPKAVHGAVSRLRRQVAPIGLAISRIRDVGYVMHDGAGCSDPRAPEVRAALAGVSDPGPA